MPPQRPHEDSDENGWTEYRMFVVEALKDIQRRQAHLELELTSLKIKVFAIALSASMLVQLVALAVKWREFVAR